MNFRMQVTAAALQQVSDQYADQPLHVIEVGCMFRENEGLSTYAIASLIAKRSAGGRFVSIEYDRSHIDASKEILQRRAPDLIDHVEYYHGHSLAMLPQVLEHMGSVHFASLDGGAHPEVCLVEFELVQEHLALDGVILVDDAHQIEASVHYTLPRPLGKATLILPMLTLRNYLKHRSQFLSANTAPGSDTGVPDSVFLQHLPPQIMPDHSECPFRLIYNTKGLHMILAYGHLAFLDPLNLGPQPVASFPQTRVASAEAPATPASPRAPVSTTKATQNLVGMDSEIESWPFLPRIRRKLKWLLMEIPFLRPILQKYSFFKR